MAKATNKKTQAKSFSVYGIYLNGDLVYIGSTNNFNRRAKEHMNALISNKHSNKTLQRLYNSHSAEDWGMDSIFELPTGNALLQFFCEFLVNSATKPICNRCVIQKGKASIILPRVQEVDLCHQILGVIYKYYRKEDFDTSKL